MNGTYGNLKFLEPDPNWGLWSHCLDYAGATDLGLRRANNQDNLAVLLVGTEKEFQRRGHLFLVADGMGAHAAGELASKIAADEIPLTYMKHPDKNPAEALRSAIQQANEKIHQRGQQSEDFQGMGTTVSALVLLPQGALVAHVGDSRVYRLRGQVLEQLTFDHSLPWELYRDQPKSEIPAGIPRNVILRSLGPRPTVEVDLEGYYPLEVGDTFLVCTDGLSGQVSNEEIATILQCLPCKEALQVFVDLANLRGGPDNITGIIVKLTGQLHLAQQGTPAGGKKNVGPQAATPSVLASLLRWLFGSGAEKKRRWGKGPYERLECPLGPTVPQTLQTVVQELRNAAANSQWQIDWDQFNLLETSGQSALQNSQFQEAVQHFSRAIICMMYQLRQQRPKIA
ncbi:MAG: protein phosphatase 2C domain-containing protein [Thermoguttaceae bacterium]|nr:protein phosphatase 2C domain-containing protein [Thermoguttaceae bacterium]MDW8038310.1 protein phosphatase 2C domain-containing protein [Thermoguttaceae bacterium]